MNKSIAGLVLGGLSFALNPNLTPKQQPSDPPELSIQVVHMGSLSQAITQVTPLLWNYTNQTGHEACAIVCVDEKNFNWVLPLTTSNSALFCVAPVSSCPQGSTPTSISVHTHSGAWELPVGSEDIKRWPELKGQIKTPNGNPYQFSEEDLKSQESYLIGPDRRVLYQKNGVVERLEFNSTLVFDLIFGKDFDAKPPLKKNE